MLAHLKRDKNTQDRETKQQKITNRQKVISLQLHTRHDGQHRQDQYLTVSNTDKRQKDRMTKIQKDSQTK